MGLPSPTVSTQGRDGDQQLKTGFTKAEVQYWVFLEPSRDKYQGGVREISALSGGDQAIASLFPHPIAPRLESLPGAEEPRLQTSISMRVFNTLHLVDNCTGAVHGILTPCHSTACLLSSAHEYSLLVQISAGWRRKTSAEFAKDSANLVHRCLSERGRIQGIYGAESYFIAKHNAHSSGKEQS